ncbi:MAG: hypothetical protein FWB91_00045 [Defluviitaleaceae bacterium]|nr:hypothetical protein [Defluviitaleaceae bacterium]
MQGIPRNIATPADLEYLFQLTTAGKQFAKKTKPTPVVADLMASFSNDAGLAMTPDVIFRDVFPAGREETEVELAGCLRRMLAQQFHRVPTVENKGATIKTRYFPEVELCERTEEGYRILGFDHIEAAEDSPEREGSEGAVYEYTEITLSSALADGDPLSAHLTDNRLTRSGFDPALIQSMLEVLTNA